MIISLTKRITLVTASLLWGILMHLAGEVSPLTASFKENSSLLTCSLEDFRKAYEALGAAQQEAFISLLKYDNYFVLMYGLFLGIYAFELWTGRNKKFPWVIALPLLYMFFDYTENYLMKQAIRHPGFTWPYFTPVQTGKWILSLGLPLALLITDLLILKNYTNVLKGIFCSILLIASVLLILN